MQLSFPLFTLFTSSAAASPDAWADSDALSSLWQTISVNDIPRLTNLIVTFPSLIFSRSSDGRGGAWWAWEFKNPDALALMSAAGLDVYKFDKDSSGKFPQEMCLENCSEISEKIENSLESAKMALQRAGSALNGDFEDNWEEVGKYSLDDDILDEEDFHPDL